MKYLLTIVASALALLGLYFYQSTNLSDKTLHVIFCDVGQGDGILIRTPTGADIIVDGGPKNGKMVACLAKYMPFWDHEIELVFATHPDADHIGGLIDVLKSYRVISFNTSTDIKGTATFDSLKTELAKQKLRFRLISTGDKFTLSDGVSISTLWPTPGFVSSDSNEYSLVQILKYGDFHALLTGDITYQILDTLDFPDSFQVLKLPHHGSKTGVDGSSFEKIRTYLAIISAGKNNRYHHPHPSVIALLKKYNIPYKRTDEAGSIEVITDGKTTKVIE